MRIKIKGGVSALTFNPKRAKLVRFQELLRFSNSGGLTSCKGTVYNLLLARGAAACPQSLCLIASSRGQPQTTLTAGGVPFILGG